MDLDFERRIVYSATFGASTLWSFVHQYAEAAPKSPAADLPLLYIVLPLVYHRPTARELERTHYDAGLLRALDRVPDLAAQLSERVEDLSPTTRASINMATASGLLLVEPTPSWPLFLPGRESLPLDLRPSEPHLRAIHATARRLGQWSALESREALWAYLDLRF
jgi:hypothetical protein